MRPSDYFGEKAWALPRRPDPLSTLMWRCEQDPALRPALVGVMLLDRPPDPQRFRAGHEWATRMIPRLRDRLVAPLLTPTMPVWSPDPEFDVTRHLRLAALPQPAGRRAVFDLAGRLAAAPFDLSRPLWESVLVEDLHDDTDTQPYRAAWLLKIHHCLADGPLIGFWLNTLLGRTRAPRADKPQPPAPPRWLDTPLAEHLIGPLAEEAAPTAKHFAREAASAARSPFRTSLAAATMAYKLLEVTTRPAGKPSPLLRRRGSGRSFEGIPIDLDQLRATARTIGVPVNAAYCAGLSAGIRQYHDAHRVTVTDIPAAITLPTTRTGTRSGNRFNGGKFAAPLDTQDPKSLCRALAARLEQARPPFPPAALDLVLTCVNQLPTSALMPMARSLGRSSDIQISHVVTLGREAYVSGARVEQMWGFAPAPGCAAMALLLTRRSQGTLALTLDTAAIPDPATFAACVAQGFADVFGAGRGSRG